MKRFSYIIEAILFLTAIIAVGYLIGDPGFINHEFHPFYFVILLITIRYGYGRGVYSMLLSGVLYTVFFLTQREYANIYEIIENCYQPLTFLAFWMFIGLLVDIDKKKIDYLTKIKIRHEKNLSQKAEEIKKLNIINENISNELITSDQSFNILFERTKNLFNEDIMMLYKAAHEILVKIIQTSEAYILYLEGDKYEIASPENPPKDWSYFDIHDKEIKEVRQSHIFIRLDMLDSHMITSQTPVFVGPIIHQSTDTLFGIIIVQELDLQKYNKNTFRTFVNLCKWMGEIMYFRTKQNLNIKPKKSDVDFKYIVEYGSARHKIKDILEEWNL
jgi:hypothetical protein